MVEISKERNKNETLKLLTLYGSLSLNLGVMILGGYYLGKLFENQYHWANMSTLGTLIGLFLGLYEMFAYAYWSTKKK